MGISNGHYNKYKSQTELIEDVRSGEDVVFILRGVTYSMGPNVYDRLGLCVCPDGDYWSFDRPEDLLDRKIDGVPLKDLWREMDILE